MSINRLIYVETAGYFGTGKSRKIKKNTDTSSEKKTAEWFKKPEYLVIALF